MRDILVPVRDRIVAATKRGAGRLTRTRAGRAATVRLRRLVDRLDPVDPLPEPVEIRPVADGTLTVADAVDLVTVPLPR